MATPPTLFGSTPPSWEDNFSARFEQFWQSAMFRKLGKQEARKHLHATVKTDADWQALERAHEAYKRDVEAHPRELLHGSTFCNQWRDFLNVEHSAPAKPDPRIAEAREILTRPDKPPDWDRDWARQFLEDLRKKS